jgi:IS5 family transposase
MNPRDPDARVTIRRGQAYFGYKAHLAVDEGSGLVRQAEMTSANVHDFCLAEALIQGDEQGYFADKAYSGQAFRETLERRGLIDGVAWRARPHHPLEDWQRLLNSWSSSIRCGVERAHATMKQWYGMSRVRYRGLAPTLVKSRPMHPSIRINPAYVRVSESTNCRKFGLPRLRREAAGGEKDPRPLPSRSPRGRWRPQSDP